MRVAGTCPHSGGPADGDKTDLDPLVQCGGYAAQHRERMAFVIGGFQARNHSSRGADQFAQLGLRETCFRSELKDLAADLVIGASLLKHLQMLWVSVEVGAMQDRGGIWR